MLGSCIVACRLALPDVLNHITPAQFPIPSPKIWTNRTDSSLFDILATEGRFIVKQEAIKAVKQSNVAATLHTDTEVGFFVQALQFFLFFFSSSVWYVASRVPSCSVLSSYTLALMKFLSTLPWTSAMPRITVSHQQ